jgi:hypothetical protein
MTIAASRSPRFAGRPTRLTISGGPRRVVILKATAGQHAARRIRLSARRLSYRISLPADPSYHPPAERITLAMQGLKRIGQPSHVADVIAFLASDGAR